MKKMMITPFPVIMLIVFLFSGCKALPDRELPLTEEEISEAIEYGRQGADLTMSEFVSDWTVSLGYGHGLGKAVIITPFLRTAIISKNAAETGRRLDMAVVNGALIEADGLIHFEVDLYGRSAGFGRTAEFHLDYAGEKIEPVYAYMPSFSQFTREYLHVVSGRVRFPAASIPEDASVVLVAEYRIMHQFEDMENVICEFEFDLGEYR